MKKFQTIQAILFFLCPLLLFGSDVFPPAPTTLYLTFSTGQTISYDTSYQGVTEVWSARPDYVTAELSGNTLTLTVGTTPGFASISYIAYGAQYSLGIVITEDGDTIPGLPSYLSMGSRSLLNWPGDVSWWGLGGQGNENYRWTDVMDIYMQGGPYDWVTQNSGMNTWQPGLYLTQFIQGCKRQGKIPCIVMYCIPTAGLADTALGDLENISDQSTSSFGANYMVYYYNIAIRTLRQVLYANCNDGWPCIVIMEPDFIGYMTQTIQANPTAEPISYNSVNYTIAVSDSAKTFGNGGVPALPAPFQNTTPSAKGYIQTTQLVSSVELGNYPNTLKGLITATPYILKKSFTADNNSTAQLGNNIKIGWKMNLWASPAAGFAGNANKINNTPFGVGKGICRWTDACLQSGSSVPTLATVKALLVEEVSALANAYYQFGITTGTDFIALDRYGRDGGANGSVPAGGGIYSGATNPLDPIIQWWWNSDHWFNYLTFIQTVQTAMTKSTGAPIPILMWQIPCGHLNNSLSTPIAGGTYAPLMDAYPDYLGTNYQGDYEDSGQPFFFGDTFNPGAWPSTAEGTIRAGYFSQDQYGQFPKPVSGVMTWRSHLIDFVTAGVFCIHSAPGVGFDFSTYVVQQGGVGPFDDNWWLDHVQNYYRSPVNLIVPAP